MIARTAILISTLALAAAAGCNWTTFDDLSDEAWAQAAGSPGDLNAGEFGTNVAWGGGAGGAVTFVVAAQRPDGIAAMTYDDAGGLSAASETVVAGGGAPNADALPVRPPMAGDPEATDAGGDTVGVVGVGLGENSAGSGRVLLYRPATGSLATSIPLGADQIHALGFGTAAGGDGSVDSLRDMVAVTGNQLHLVSDYQVSSRQVDTCTLARDRGYSAVIAELDSSSAEAEVVVAQGNTNQDGAASTVMVLSGATITAAADDTGDNSCIAGARTALTELTAPGDEPDFGTEIVVADFDGGNGLDIAVGAPASNSVYVYMNVDLSGGGAPGAPTRIEGPSGSGAFGLTLAAGDFDGDGSDELVIGDPQATAEGTSNAGRAYIVPSDGDFGTQYALGDADPESDQNFGRGVAVGTFAGTGTVLIVGAKGEVFTYFRTQISDDVRN